MKINHNKNGDHIKIAKDKIIIVSKFSPPFYF